MDKILCNNSDSDCGYKELVDEKYNIYVCNKPDMPVLAPEYCVWRRLAES